MLSITLCLGVLLRMTSFGISYLLTTLLVRRNTSTRKADYIIPDCIDIQIEIVPVPFEKMAERHHAESSASIRERVIKAREIQAQRFANHPGIYCNAQMEAGLLHLYAQPNEAGLKLLRTAMTRLNLSARAYGRILKVARTIADLDNSEHITSIHLAEAISYRNLDREDWAG